MKLSMLGAAIALSLAGAHAFATTQADIPGQPPAIPGTGLVASSDTASPLLVAVWDQNTGSSLVQYLGLNYSQVAPNQITQNGLVLDFGTLSGWSSTFDAVAGGQTSRLLYGVFSVDAFSLDAPGAKGIRTTGLGDTFAPGDAFNVDSATTQVAQYINNVINFVDSTTCSRSNPCSVHNNENSPIYFGSIAYGTTLGGLATTADITGAVGTALSFFNVTSDSSDFSATATQFVSATNNAGKWLLDAAGHLTYSVAGASAVPLPAAVWLLLSALTGFGVMGRRRPVDGAVAA